MKNVLPILCMLFFFSCDLERVEVTGVQASFSFDNDGCTAPCAVTFTNNSFAATSYEWNFGDNSAVSNEENPIHTYDVGGEYTVTLIATDADNNTDTSTAQVMIIEQPIEFSTTLGVGGSWEEGREVLQVSDGGYLVVANNLDCPQDKCLEVYKLDRNGQQEWSKKYAYQSFTQIYPNDLIEVGGNQPGYIIAGYTVDGTNDQDGYAMKMDVNGNILWEDDYGMSNNDERFLGVVQGSDGSFYFCGEDDDRIWMVRTNSTGDQTWSKRDGTYDGPATAICEMANGNLLILSGHPYDQVRLLQYTTAGTFVSTVQIGDANSNVSNDMIATSDGGYLITGERGFDQYVDIYVVKINSNLAKEWEKTFADNGWFEAGHKLVETANGDLAILANRDLNVPILIRLDNSGNQIFYKEFSAGDGYGLDACSDDGFIITGHDGSQGIMVIKTDKDGNF